MKLLLDALNLKPTSSYNIPPIWLMRQAGRYLPEYRAVRANAGSFLDLCYNPELASLVTLQPIERFDFDAAIIFSDILIVPHALGLNVEFKEKEGPVVERVNNLNDLSKLQITSAERSVKFQKVYEAISLTKQKLEPHKTLIGFAGSPWTVATYIMAGRQEHDACRKLAYTNFEFVESLIEIITEQTIIHLLGQIKAGADIVQLFDSWSGILTPKLFESFVIKPTMKIVNAIKRFHPNFPVIGFPKGAGLLYKDYAEQTNIDVLGLDHLLSLDFAKQLQSKVVVQGNLDPLMLFCSKDQLQKGLDQILENLAGNRFIFNLGHGIVPDSPVENVKFLVEYVRKFRK